MLHLRNAILLISIFILSCTDTDPNLIDPSGSDEDPNILLIIADDLGIDATPGYDVGSEKPNMPHLENLISEGIIFDNAWSFPVCSPTRASIITGKYGYRTGVLNAESASNISSDELTLQRFIDQNTNDKYAHAIIGKWHLSGRNDPDRPMDMGVGYYAGLLSGGVDNYFDWRLTENGATSATTEYITTKITDLSINWIQEQTQPWFCWVAFNAPHNPIHLPPDSLHYQGVLPSDQESIDVNPLPYYMAMVESIDHEIGRILNSLDPLTKENTMIIFIGDNGTARGVIQNPYNRNQGKGTLYQGGIHVPLIVSGTYVTRNGQRENQLISSTDLFATISEIAGIDVSSYRDSYSFYNLFSSNNPGMRTYNYSEILDDSPDRSGYTIRNQRYKMIHYDDLNMELFDLDEDPFEQANLLETELTESESEALNLLIEEAMNIRQ